MSDEEVQSSPECAPARSHYRSEDDNPTSIPTADAFSLFSTGHWSSNCPEISGLTTPAVPNERSPHILKKSISPIKTSTPIYIRRNLFTQNHEISETKRADIQNLLFTNIDVSQDNLEEDHKEEHVLDNEEDIEEVTEEDHVVDHEKDHMEDIEEEHKVFQSALDKLSDEGKRERFLIFFISGRFPLKQHCIRPVFGHC
ncbi:unnamed protein product [Mytilus edulis]|uniref:Uncharacterized protein n=1 Tax=Mytilus edulis TaxID=6550 RepID=A0A8S3U5A0_MYTED|nr:unnamed protein product [Mytilus edulis]